MNDEENIIDQNTRRMDLKPPIVRENSAPLPDNPIKRFRLELRLDLGAFAELLGTPRDTVKEWESERLPRLPGLNAVSRLISLARRNEYPLFVEDIEGYVIEKRAA